MTSAVNSWQQLSSRELHRTPWLRLIEDKVIKPDGTPGQYTYIEAHPFVCVITQDIQGRLLVIQQWRYILGQLSWEFPAGSCDEGEAAEETGPRELREETGVTAVSWTHVGSYYESNSHSRCRGDVMLAQNLTVLSEVTGAAEEGIVAHRWVTPAELDEMIRQGQITDSVTLAAWAIYRTRR